MSTSMATEAEYERTLDDFDLALRTSALTALREAEEDAVSAASTSRVNLHAHTFYSYNPRGYSPSHFAWLAHKAGLKLAGMVDFDVLDGLEEFMEAGRILNLRTCVSVESRVFVPEFADKVINSPGEPGIAYHMGVGFVRPPAVGEARVFLRSMRARAEERTRQLVERVNAFLDPVTLDYAEDVAPLTPKGNATERHVCRAYVDKAAQLFPDAEELAAFWAGKLGELPQNLDLPAGPELQALLRAKTMKRGGVGYVQPDGESFPLMADMNRFTLASGAIPTLCWLDGTSDGEREMERYIAVGASTGAAALNLIPHRNYTAGLRDEKLQNLYDVVALAEKYGLPLVVGTELNSPGQPFVDDFDSNELAPIAPRFMEGAYIVYGHTVLQSRGGMGYTSEWAAGAFAHVEAKNRFFAEVGRRLRPNLEASLDPLKPDLKPGEILDRVRKSAS